MNFKLIQQNNFTEKTIAINPKKIKKISLDYEIIYEAMSKSQLNDIQNKLGEKLYQDFLKNDNLNDLINIIKENHANINDDNLNHLMNAIKENNAKPKIDEKIKNEIIDILGDIKIDEIFRNLDIDIEIANITKIIFLLKNDDITIKYSVRLSLNSIENYNFKGSLDKELNIAQSLFLEDYVKQLCSPNLATMIIPKWDILESAIKNAKQNAKQYF